MTKLWWHSVLLAVSIGCAQSNPPSNPVAVETVSAEATANDELESDDVHLVTLSLPNMTCPICAKEVRTDLAKLDSVSAIETDVKANTCKFKLADKDLDLQAKLDELAADNESLKGFKVVKK